jgi:putative ABC transport system substrate-binding protein
MRRREFIALLGGVVVTWPPGAGAADDKFRRIGVLDAQAETDLAVQAADNAFRKRLDELGWIAGRNIHIEYRWGAGSVIV